MTPDGRARHVPLGTSGEIACPGSHAGATQYPSFAAVTLRSSGRYRWQSDETERGGLTVRCARTRSGRPAARR